MLPEEEAIAQFRQHLIDVSEIQGETWSMLLPMLRVENMAKGALALQEGKVCQHIYFLYSGSFRAFHRKENGDETTTGLFIPGHCFTNMNSISTSAPSVLNIQALENSVVVMLRKSDMTSLYSATSDLESVSRMMLERMIAEENEWKEMYRIFNPEERYHFLLQHAPLIIQRIPLQFIASFLGMRRETLSRIRNKATKRSSF